jgi:hypothetical protein
MSSDSYALQQVDSDEDRKGFQVVALDAVDGHITETFGPMSELEARAFLEKQMQPGDDIERMVRQARRAYAYEK